MVFRAAVTALLFASLAPAALGAPQRALVVNLENRRKVALTKFEILAPAQKKQPEKIVASLEKALAAGGHADLKLSRAKGCVFEARWKFEDLEDSGSVDICNDAHIVLVD
jgi:hypothetical protein